MTRQQDNFIRGQYEATFADDPDISVSDWCCQNLRFDEPDNRGPFTLNGREYVREPLDNWAKPFLRRQTLVWGSQSTKTGTIMGGTAWLAYHQGARIFWAMPNKDLVKKFSATRWMQLIRASPIFEGCIPVGAERNEFATFQQRLRNSVIDFVWAGSPAALSSTPARVVNLDEVDKFNEATEKEADSSDLAEQRTKSFSNPKITDTSTPTTEEGQIWQSFLRSDQRRRNVPCPSCGKLVIFAWSPEYTIFPLVGKEAFVKWDKEARRPNGSWDLDRVERSARYECAHCGFHIQDRHKTLIDRKGIWVPSEKRCQYGDEAISPVDGHYGYQLPSFYAPSSQCNVGRLAVKFLQKKNTLDGLQGIINGDFAEPYANQDKRGKRVEIIIRDSEQKPEGTKILTADFQASAPHLWYVVRVWGKSFTRAIEAGPLMEFDQLKEVQDRHAIKNNHVAIDSGDQTMTVYEQCVRHGFLKKRPQKVPLSIGWMPFKGISREGWSNKNTGAKSKVRLQPMEHFIGGRMVAMPLLEFVDHDLKKYLEGLRKKQITALQWEVDGSVANDEYWRHMDGEILIRERNIKNGKWDERWKPRSKTWPNHLLDCEKAQLAMAIFHRLIIDDAIGGPKHN